jgi:Family of unknown function (DUF6600)
MIDRYMARRLLLGTATGLALAVAGVSVPIMTGALTPAMAQSSDDMAAALNAYGHWIRDARYGEVWVPDGVPPDWRPYEYGHWVYTDDWGWYWVSDDAEDDWGWVVYHYGRWAYDRNAGWFWVPGDEWAPAWVDWRYGGDDIGWAPMPPDDLIDAYDDDAEYWSFVPLRYIGEPELRRYYVPRDRRVVVLRDTRIINRPVHIEGRRVWVNPGLAPGFIAGHAHVTLHAYNVHPRVFGGTAGVQGAVTVRRDELRNKGDIQRVAPVTIQRTTTAIAPTTNVPPPKPLSKGEHGVLGNHPPRAAQGTVTPQPQPQVQPQTQPKPGAAGPPPKGPATIQQHNAPAPTVTPTTPSAPPKQQPPERHEERRVVPPGGAAQPKPNVVHPVTPAPPPPKQPVPPEHTPPPAAHAPPPPQVHAPPPPHAPPPAAVHTPPSKPPPPKKPPVNKPEPPK